MSDCTKKDALLFAVNRYMWRVADLIQMEKNIGTLHNAYLGICAYASNESADIFGKFCAHLEKDKDNLSPENCFFVLSHANGNICFGNYADFEDVTESGAGSSEPSGS